MNRQLFNAMVAQYGTKTVMDTNQVLEWSGGAHCNLPSLKFYGECKQYGTPTPDNPLSVFAFDGTATVSGRGSYLFTPKLYGIKGNNDEWDYVTGKGVRRVASVTLDGVSDGKKILGVYFHQNSGLYYGVTHTEYTVSTNTDATARILSTHFITATKQEKGYVYLGGSGTEKDRMLLLWHTDQTLDTVDKWNSWLKAQYDAGTPVAIYYGLTEPQPFEERPDYDPYQPIPNDSGSIDIIDIIDSGFSTPFEISYVRHHVDDGDLINFAKREIVDFGAFSNTTKRSFTGNGLIMGVAANNYYATTTILAFSRYASGFEFSASQTPYGIGFDLKLSPNTTYICSAGVAGNRSDNIVYLAEYDGDGNWLRTVYSTKSADGKARLIKTSANAVWGVFIFQNPTSKASYRYSNVSIRKE